MTTTPHTPGPWNLHNNYKGKPLVVTGCDGESWIAWERIIAQGDMFIGSVQATTAPKPGWPRVTNPLEMEANARLIAAAPELLEALTQAENRLSKCIPENHGIHPNPEFEIVEQARAAIRKAKGEA